MPEHRTVYITERTADGLKSRAKEFDDLVRRFNAVGSFGRADELKSVAETLRKMAFDLKDELRAKRRSKLPQIDGHR